jgi:hypothetical protein
MTVAFSGECGGCLGLRQVSPARRRHWNRSQSPKTLERMQEQIQHRDSEKVPQDKQTSHRNLVTQALVSDKKELRLPSTCF